MIVMWLVEIYLNMMSHRVTGRATASISSAMASNDLNDEDDDESAEEAFADQTSRELLTLMKQPKVAECIANNRNTFYDLVRLFAKVFIIEVISCFVYKRYIGIEM